MISKEILTPLPLLSQDEIEGRIDQSNFIQLIDEEEELFNSSLLRFPTSRESDL